MASSPSPPEARAAMLPESIRTDLPRVIALAVVYFAVAWLALRIKVIHDAVPVGVPLTVVGTVTERFVKKGRTSITVRVTCFICRRSSRTEDSDDNIRSRILTCISLPDSTTCRTAFFNASRSGAWPVCSDWLVCSDIAVTAPSSGSTLRTQHPVRQTRRIIHDVIVLWCYCLIHTREFRSIH